MWIGLTDENHEGVWLWLNDAPLNYSIWASSQPNGRPDTADQDCAMVTNTDWNRVQDQDCGSDANHWLCSSGGGFL